MHWSEVWHGKRAGPAWLRTGLTPLSWLYAAGWQGYLLVYRLGLKRPREPHRPVVCVGNLVAGGSGKSPFALFVARELQALGREVVLSCSGYGAPRSEGATLAPEGPLDAREWGDEPAMHRWLSPELPIVVGRARVRAAELCREHYPDAVMLMDDGFQHLPLRKHVTIVLDPLVPNRRCLPAGPYREPARNRSRADLVLPGRFRLTSRLAGLLDPHAGRLGEEDLSGLRADALCALARPERFFGSLRNAGVQIERALALPDHAPLDAGNLLGPLSPGLPLVVTAKDWVKLRDRADLEGRRVLVALHEVRAEPAEEFRRWLAQRLDELAIERTAR